MREYQANHPGTVRKRLNAGVWQAVVWYRDTTTAPDGATETGPWRQRTKLLDVRCYPDKDGRRNNRGKKAAEAAMLKWRAELEAAEPARAKAEELEAAGELTGRSTVAEHVCRHIDTLEAVGAVEPSTAATYRRCAELIGRGANPRRHDPTPGLGGVALADLAPSTVQAWVNGLAGAYRPINVNKAVTLLRAVCSSAVRGGVIDHDPTDGVRVPKAPREEPNALPPGELARLMEDLEAPRPRERPQTVMGMRLAVHTGMRRGEVCGLRWRDVDLDGGTLKVREVVGIDGSGSTYLKAPKTDGSRRDIPLTPELAGWLASWRDEVGAKCRAAGERFRPELFVCGDVDGSYQDPKKLGRAFRRRADRLGLVGTQGRRPTFHDLRHTFATVAIAKGADIKSISSIMGHASAAMTLDIYASPDADAKRLAMDRVGAALAGRGAAVGAVPDPGAGEVVPGPEEG